MKRISFILTLLFTTLTSMNAATKISRIEPANWFAGMKNHSLQLMVYGKGIRDCEVTLNDYDGARIDSVARLDSPDYLLVYLNLGGAKPGKLMLNFADRKGGKQKIAYPILPREKSGEERIGFSNKDVLYMLMPDRFAQGKKEPLRKDMNKYVVDRTKPSLRHGGDLEGIRQHLDYFNQLGVTALWFTPVLENDSPDNNGFSTYHGYATTDYYRVDPRFGSNDEYRQLIKEAHAKGLKVVMDMIFNHCGFEHPWVKNMPSKDWFNTPEWLNEKQSSGRDIYTGMATGEDAGKSKYLQTSYKLTPVLDPYASKIDKHETVDGWFVPSMPDLNQRNPHVITYLIQNSEWWIETVGIDGIRMDTYPYADRKAMALWLKTLEEEYPNFNVVGETWVTEPAYTAAWQRNSKLCKENSHLRTVMDFSFFDKLNKGKNEETDAWWEGLNRIYNSFVYDYLYTNPRDVMAFIENHDTDRFLGNGHDMLSLKQALALLLTVNRTPQLYYGTEILMNGTKEVTDGNVRKDFPGGFFGDKRNAFTKDGRTAKENEMFDWLSALLHWRQTAKEVTEGTQTQFIPYNGIYVIARQYNGKTSLTILNGTSKPATFCASRYAEVIESTPSFHDVITGKPLDLSKDFTLSPRQSLVVEN
jgi:glycosidase